MSVEQTNQVDAIGVEAASEKVILTISDHLDWKDEHSHLALLQEKLNSYIAFVESGELVSAYPDAQRRVPVLDIVARVAFPVAATDFFTQVRPVLSSIGIELRARVMTQSREQILADD